MVIDFRTGLMVYMYMCVRVIDFRTGLMVYIYMCVKGYRF